MDKYKKLVERLRNDSSECEIFSMVKWGTDFNLAADAIEELLKHEWIPCSERLPEESGRYLVTNTQWGAYHVDWNIYYVNVEGHCDGWLWEQGCIAWMPLPEPYRGERTEE